ncbi:nas-15 [Symbiodinium natans]|uniref:Metalloendopeptidase n=1 Tax=Symbiodinium natans TaxID=878477 RepID=A0A812KUL0_9DINO|nr:nas-15 [Symbiodinium natans]
MAKHVKWSCENDFLPEESYDSVVQVMSELSSLVNTPEGLIEAAEQGATLTSDDVHWITKHMKKEEVIHGLYGFEDAETGATNGACSKKGVACDEGSGSLGAGTPWDGAKVKFCYDVALAASAREALQCAMAKITGHVPGIMFENVQYAGLDRCGASPAIYFQSNGRRSGGGCWSDIGMSTSLFGGNQKLNLQSPGCDNCGTATHELLHALGMAHEQSRPDRDGFVTIVWNNIKQGMDGQFTKNPRADTARPYDIMSIMHYGSRSFSKNGQDTILVKPSGYHLYTTNPSQFAYYRVGQRMGMSRQDVSQLADLYGCSPASNYQSCQPSGGGGGSNFIAILSPEGAFSDTGCTAAC